MLLYQYSTLFLDKGLLTRIAYFGKTCVGIYTFISGYAFSQNLVNQNSKDAFSFKCRIIVLRRQLLAFMSKYWLVCLIFLPLGMLLHKISPTFHEVVFTVLLGGNTINGEWWYVTQYIVYLCTLPFIEYIFSKHNSVCLTRGGSCASLWVNVCCCLVISFIVWLFDCSKMYFVLFLLSYMIGYYGVFERLNKTISISKPMIIILLLLSVSLRIIVVSDVNDITIDIIIVPLMVYFIVLLFHVTSSKNISIISKTLKSFGKYSSFIWLTHTFWIYYYFQRIVFWPKFSIAIFALVFILSLITAFVLDKIHGIIQKRLVIMWSSLKTRE